MSNEKNGIKVILLLMLATFAFGLFVLNNLINEHGSKIISDIKCLDYHNEIRVLLKDESISLDKNENIIKNRYSINITSFFAIFFSLVVVVSLYEDMESKRFFFSIFIMLIIISFFIQNYIDTNKLTQFQKENKSKKEIALKTEKCYYENHKIGWINDKKYFSLLNNKKKLNADDYFFLSNIYKKGKFIFKDINKSKEYLNKATTMGSLDAKKTFAKSKKELGQELYYEGNYKDLKIQIVDKGFGFECKYTELLYQNNLTQKADNFAKKYNCKDIWARFH